MTRKVHAFVFPIPVALSRSTRQPQFARALGVFYLCECGLSLPQGEWKGVGEWGFGEIKGNQRAARAHLLGILLPEIAQ